MTQAYVTQPYFPKEAHVSNVRRNGLGQFLMLNYQRNDSPVPVATCYPSPVAESRATVLIVVVINLTACFTLINLVFLQVKLCNIF